MRSTCWRSLHPSVLFPHPFCLISGGFFVLFCLVWWNFGWRIFSGKWFHCLLWIVKWHPAVKWNFPLMNLCEIQGLPGGACQRQTLCWVSHKQPQLMYLTALWYGMVSFICGQEKWELEKLGDWSSSKMSVCNSNSVLFSLYITWHLFTALPKLPPKADPSRSSSSWQCTCCTSLESVPRLCRPCG